MISIIAPWISQAGPLPMGLSLEQFAAASGTMMMAVMLLMLLRGDLLTKRSHERIVELLQGTIEAKDEEIGRMASDRDLWRDVAANALDVSEALVGRRPGG